MRRLISIPALLLCPLIWLTAPSWARPSVWVDAQGRTHLTDDPARVAASMPGRALEPVEDPSDHWRDRVTGPPVESRGASSGEEDRLLRVLRGAVDDLARGETARAATALKHVLSRSPNRPEAHWYLALLDWQRGRLDSAERHLRVFLGVAGDRFEPWRASANRRLRRLEDERRLLEPPRGDLHLVSVESAHFRVEVDDDLRRASPDFSDTVLRYLAEARAEVGDRLGIYPGEPTGVVLYGRAAYLRAHRHRFSFQTVGFYDGRIHVVSAAHPAGELRTLLFHEYTHALFRERAGGDRPFWLNEGLAELAERGSQGLAPLTHSEHALLRRHIDSGDWIDLGRLAPSFGGLTNTEARMAYLEATAAAAWIEARTDRSQRARLLRLLGEGHSDDDALRQILGVDTNGLDAALRREIRARFAPALARPAHR